MQLPEAFEPEQQKMAEFVLQAKHTLNGVEPSLKIAASNSGSRRRLMSCRFLGLASMFEPPFG
jgi:hypothetical protein